MARNSSGFVDFQQLMDLNGDEERALIEKAMERAQAATQGANTKLTALEHRGARDAQTGALNGTGGPTALADTASYSDYLEAKKGAAREWAAVTAKSRSPRSIRDSLLGGANTAATASGDGLDAGEARADASIGAGRELGTRGAADLATYRAEQAEKAKAAEVARQIEENRRIKLEMDWQINDAKTTGRINDQRRAEDAADKRRHVEKYGTESGWSPRITSYEAPKLKYDTSKAPPKWKTKQR